MVAGTIVSRETIGALETYVRLLAEASSKQNLIGPKELPYIWVRHIVDSAQLYPYVCHAHSVTDLGTGAGLPGVVLSLLGVPKMYLIDATQKKCDFLENVSRETNRRFSVMNARVEALKKPPSKMFVSRAMAPLDRLLEWVSPWVKKDHTFVLLKGARALEEVEVAQKKFSFGVKAFPSETDPNAHVVHITNIKKACSRY